MAFGYQQNYQQPPCPLSIEADIIFERPLLSSEARRRDRRCLREIVNLDLLLHYCVGDIHNGVDYGFEVFSAFRFFSFRLNFKRSCGRRSSTSVSASGRSCRFWTQRSC
jgi:hypothetical protein